MDILEKKIKVINQKRETLEDVGDLREYVATEVKEDLIQTAGSVVPQIKEV